jgi:pyrroloquinoline quinone (PQQ) biosynthesis protein C
LSRTSGISAAIGGTPDHVELYQRIGDDMGYPRDAWERVTPIPEMKAIVDFFRRLAYELPWSASLCTTAFIEAEVVEVTGSREARIEQLRPFLR